MTRSAPQAGGSFMEQLHAAANFILANLLFVILALPLVTLPAASAGLTAVMTQWTRGQRPEALPVFLAAFRRHFLGATLLAATSLLLALAPALNLLITLQAASGAQQLPALATGNPLLVSSAALSAAALLFLAALNLYLWPLLILTSAAPRTLWRTALRLVLLRPATTLLTLAASLLAFGSGLFLPRAAMLFLSVAAASFTANFGATRVLRHHDLNELLRHGPAASS
jgi:uncharacterized membrane protein YesL